MQAFKITLKLAVSKGHVAHILRGENVPGALCGAQEEWVEVWGRPIGLSRSNGLCPTCWTSVVSDRMLDDVIGAVRPRRLASS